MNAKLKLQKQQLQTALHLAEQIEKCDAAIEVGRHVNHFKGVRQEAIAAYADAVAEIVENSIDIAVEFQKVHVDFIPFDQKLMNHLNSITTDYEQREFK